MASETILKQKEEEVKALAEKFTNSKLVLLTDYRGITVDAVTSLRNELRDVNAEYKVIKNNITKRALETNGESELDSVLEGPTAVITAEEDYLSPLKAIYKFSKDNEFYKIKGGIVEGKVLSVDELITLAKLPSRQELLGMLAGGLLGTISKLAVGLDQVRVQKENA
jgi:large subunit ribosomal protein L10